MPTRKKLRTRMAKELHHEFHVPFILAHRIAKAVSSELSWGETSKLIDELTQVMKLTLNPKQDWKQYFDYDYDDRLATYYHYTYTDKYGQIWQPYCSWMGVLVPANLSGQDKIWI